MDGYIFLEVDNSGNPVYGDKLEELLNCGNQQMIFILSSEYQANYAVKLVDYEVVTIPDDVIEKIDDKIEEKENRGTYLSISNVEEFDSWIEEQIEINKIQVLTTIEHYTGISHICKKRHVFMTYMFGNRVSNTGTTIAEADNGNLQLQIQQQSTMIQELKNEIQDKKVYIDSILTHATNLDNELKKYRNWYEQSPRYGEKVEKLEKINDKCTQLYKETLEKMDKLLVENLNLKKKYKVK